MNGIRCPQCNLVSPLSATQCRKCSLPFGNLPQSAYVSVPIEETFGSTFGNSGGGGTSPTAAIPRDNETGRKTFFWYRIYCASLVVLYLLVTVGGAYVAYERPSTREYSSDEMMIMGIIYAALGAIFFLVFLVALLLPRKPFNWIVGIVMLAIGMTSCCFIPFVIPIFIYWLKPETKAYFGRD